MGVISRQAGSSGGRATAGGCCEWSPPSHGWRGAWNHHVTGFRPRGDNSLVAARSRQSDIWRGNLFSGGFIYNQHLKSWTRGDWGSPGAAAGGRGLGGHPLGLGLAVWSSGLEGLCWLMGCEVVAGCGPGDSLGPRNCPRIKDTCSQRR